MPGFRMTSPNPFWFEDLVFFVMDESRRLPERISSAAAHARRAAKAGTAALLGHVSARRRRSAPARAATAARATVLCEAELLDEPLAWTLATEPLATSASAVEKIVQLQEKAREQLGAITYVLDRLRDDLAPALTHVRLAESNTHADETIRLDTSVEALLALSRRNAATRPRDRVLSAA